MNKAQRQKAYYERVAEAERQEAISKLGELKNKRILKEESAEAARIADFKASYVSKAAKYSKWLTSIKESLVYDCLYSLYSEAFGSIKTGTADPKYDGMKQAIVKSFISENSSNIDAFIYSMKYKSELMSEMAALITETVDKIKETTDKDDESTYILQSSIKDDFFDRLNMLKPDDVVYTIRNRVTDAVEDFVTQATAEKIEIKDIMKHAKERIEASNSDTMKESYNLAAKRKLTKVYSAPKGLLYSMVENLSEAAHKNEELGKRYKNTNGSLDMDAIVETCEILYAFLETVNTTKLITLDEATINDILENIKR